MHYRDIFSIFYNMKVYFFLIKIASIVDTIYHFQYKKITLNYPKIATLGFFEGTPTRTSSKQPW